MAKDEFKNLGFKDEKPASSTKSDGAEEGDKSKPGELRW